MTREDLFALHSRVCVEALDLMKRKNADYSKGDSLGNFYVCESLQVCTAAEGVVVRLSDKLSRLVSVMAKGAEVNESLDDTCVDIINYTVLLMALLRDKR